MPTGTVPVAAGAAAAAVVSVAAFFGACEHARIVRATVTGGNLLFFIAVSSHCRPVIPSGPSRAPVRDVKRHLPQRTRRTRRKALMVKRRAQAAGILVNGLGTPPASRGVHRVTGHGVPMPPVRLPPRPLRPPRFKLPLWKLVRFEFHALECCG